VHQEEDDDDDDTRDYKYNNKMGEFLESVLFLSILWFSQSDDDDS